MSAATSFSPRCMRTDLRLGPTSLGEGTLGVTVTHIKGKNSPKRAVVMHGTTRVQPEHLREYKNQIASTYRRLGGVVSGNIGSSAVGKRVIGLLVGAGAFVVGGVILAAGPAMADNGPHVSNAGTTAIGSSVDGCAGCHRLHAAKGDQLACERE